MKRDMDLCRKILFAVEDCDERFCYDLKLEGYKQEEVNYNAKLLFQCGFIDKVSEDLTGNLILGSLTWAGHDFLEKIREDTVWNHTKEVITKKGLPMVVDVIKQVSAALITSMTEGAIKAIMDKGGV